MTGGIFHSHPVRLEILGPMSFFFVFFYLSNSGFEVVRNRLINVSHVMYVLPVV